MRTLYDAVRREASSHRRLVGIALLILFLLGAVGALAPRLLQANSAHADPAVTLNGSDGPIVLSTDGLGVPHITARSTRDAAFGIGYAEASDRLWQMDFLRRTGEGRVAEILGPGPDGVLTSQDALMRTIIPPTLASAKVAQSSANTQTILNAFVAGVNTVQSHAISTGTLPREFTLLHYTPATWTASDVMAELLGVSAGLNLDSWLTKLERANLAAQFGPDVANALTPDPLTNATLVDRNGQLNPLATRSRNPYLTPPPAAPAPVASFGGARAPAALASWAVAAQSSATLARALVGAGGRMSNNFAIDATRSATGKPLLENDLHLQAMTPSPNYLAEVAVTGNGGGAAEGALIPGIPLFINARNSAGFAFDVTFSLLDDTDLYLETPCTVGGAPGVIVQGACAPTSVRHETIAVAGGAQVTLDILTTPHGPTLNAANPALDGFPPLALKWAAAQPDWRVDGLFTLSAARDHVSAASSLQQISIGLNIVYAEAQSGRIGYQMTGFAPRRSLENTRGPVDGSDGAHEWNGSVPYALLPHVFNPAGGVLATGNNPIAPADYAPGGVPTYLSSQTDTPDRAVELTRALSGLTASGTVSVNAFGQQALDTRTQQGQALAPLIAAAIHQAGAPAGDPDAAFALAALDGWNANVDANSAGALIYEVVATLAARDMTQSLLPATATDDRAALYQGYTAAVFTTTIRQALWGQVSAPTAPFFGATGPSNAAHARDLAMSRALGEADALLRGALGASHQAWTWGALHQRASGHPLALGEDPTGVVYPEFAIPVLPRPGDASTPNLGGWDTQAGLLALPPDQFEAAGGAFVAFGQDAASASRTVWNLGDTTHSLVALSSGQSGAPASSHYADQVQTWQNGRYFTISF